MFRNTGANAFAKNQTCLAYEDKRDLYCMWMPKEQHSPSWSTGTGCLWKHPATWPKEPGLPDPIPSEHPEVLTTTAETNTSLEYALKR